MEERVKAPESCRIVARHLPGTFPLAKPASCGVLQQAPNNCPQDVHTLLREARIGQTRINMGRVRFGQLLAKFSHTWSELPNLGPMSNNFGRQRPHLDRFRPDLVRTRPIWPVVASVAFGGCRQGTLCRRSTSQWGFVLAADQGPVSQSFRSRSFWGRSFGRRRRSRRGAFGGTAFGARGPRCLRDAALAYRASDSLTSCAGRSAAPPSPPLLPLDRPVRVRLAGARRC